MENAHIFSTVFFVYLYPFFVCNRMPDGSVTKLLFILGFFSHSVYTLPPVYVSFDLNFCAFVSCLLLSAQYTLSL